MVRFQRSGRVSGGNFPEALKFSKEIVEYINDSAARKNAFQVYMERFGNVGTIYFVADFENLAALESTQNKLLSDPEYWTILKRGITLFIDGSFKDTVMTSA